MDESSAQKETAKAVQEVAKTVSAYESSVREVGAFFHKILGEPLIETSGIITDRLRARRIQNMLLLRQNYDRFVKDRNITNFRKLDFSVATNLLEAASIEENDGLSEMFAHLLLSYSDDNQQHYVSKRFIDILKNLTPFEAKILQAVYKAPAEAISEHGVIAAYLPDRYVLYDEIIDHRDPDVPEKTYLALANLSYLGCIHGNIKWSGERSFSKVRVTEYGQKFLQACGIDH